MKKQEKRDHFNSEVMGKSAIINLTKWGIVFLVKMFTMKPGICFNLRDQPFPTSRLALMFLAKQE